MRLFEVKSEYVLFVDLDGVLSDLDGKVYDLIGRHFEEIRGPLFTDFLATVRDKGNTFFDTLEKTQDADVLWGYIKKYTPHILTATGPEQIKATAEKIKWVHNNLVGFDQILAVISGRDKQQYAQKNHILIDDTAVNVYLWENAGGTGILHTDAYTTIDRLTQLGL